jgi:nucleoside phosphorylase/HEAT repeat protein
MKAFIESPKEVYVRGRGAGRRYYVGEIPARDGGRHTVALCHSGVGNNNAAIRASLMLQHFDSIKSVIMVGIAGGVPNPANVEEHVRLGDIVVSSEGGVTQYDLGKEIATIIDGELVIEFKEKNPARAPDPLLLEAIELLEVEEYDGHRPWIDHLESMCQRSNTPRPSPETDILSSSEDPTLVISHPNDPSRISGQPRLFTGKIGSANILLKNPIRRDYLRDTFAVKAIEMEGSGVADASWKMERGYLVVRGVCDYCDSKKNDAWQKYAAVVAASYARALIESIPTLVHDSDEEDHDGARPKTTVNEYLAAVKMLAETDAYIALPEHSGPTQVPLLLRRTDPQTDEQKRPMVLNALLEEEHSEPHVMFIGGGGAGKSTLLRRIARDVWQSPESLGLKKRYLPMIIRLSAFPTTEQIVIEDRLRDAMYKAGELSLPGDLPKGFFSDWPKQLGTSWFLLFDGLDEVSTDQRPALIAQLSPLLETVKQNGNSVALTSRPGDFSRQLESRLTPYTLLGFTSQQQKQFAQDCFGADAGEFLKQIKDLEADDFNGNPLLFTIAAVVFRRDRQLKRKASLYERFIQIWLDEAAVRGLRSDLGDDLYHLTQSVLEELAFEMTEQPAEVSSVVLSRKVALYLKDKLGVPIPKAQAQGKVLVNVLGIRSGVFIKTGVVCDWAHANFREYLAGRSLDTQLLESGNNYERVLGHRPFNGNWGEAISALVQVNDKSTDILNWMAAQTVRKEDVQSSLLVYYYWTQSRDQADLEGCKLTVDALLAGLIDPQAGLRGPEMIKDALVEMGSRAVPALVAALQRLNGLQKELFPGWKGKKAPGTSSESGTKLYKGYRQRLRIVEVLGEIKDVRSFDELISLLFEDEEDSNRFYLQHAAQRSLTCIGEKAVPSLLRIVEDAAHSTKNRRQALVALRSIGKRNDQVSETLGACLREGLSGNHDLLRWALFAAIGLRDQGQSTYAAQALSFSNQEVVASAAGFFSAMPDRAYFNNLVDALKRWKQMDAPPFGGEAGLKSLLSALMLGGDSLAGRLVRGVISCSLRGQGPLGAHEALREAEKLSIGGLRTHALKTAISQLVETERPHRNALISSLHDLWVSIVRVVLGRGPRRCRKEKRKNLTSGKGGIRLNDALEFLGSTWRPRDLRELQRATQTIESSVEAGGVEELISRYVRKTKDGSQMGLVDESGLLHTLAKCQVNHFSEHAGRLLEEADWDFQSEVSDILWVAGDVGAEEALLSKLKTIRADHKSGGDPISELYHVIRALGTCSTGQGAEIVVETVLWNSRIDINFSKDVLRVLLKREVLDPNRLVTLAETPDTHEYARNFFIEALGYFDAPRFSPLFSRMLAENDEHVRLNAAHFLGWSKDPNVVDLLIDLLRTTESSLLAETAAESLRRLKASEAFGEIMQAVERFGRAQRLGLIREAAYFKDPALVKYLKPTSRSNEWIPWERGDLLDAVGEFYNEPWAQIILEEWLENTRIGLDTGQQRWAFSVLAKRDPDKLLRQAVRLYDEKGLEDSARSRLVVLLARLMRSRKFNFGPLLPLLKRLLCDEDLWMRESVAEDLVYLSPAQRWEVYTELSSVGNDWAQACGVYSLAFWDSDESEIERQRYSAIRIVRFFADRALTVRRKRPHLRQLSDSFIGTEGVARVSSYLALIQEGSEQDLHYIDERLEPKSIAAVFLPHMQSEVQSLAKKRREELMKEEQELFCNSSRQVFFNDVN